jgi:hypothetical protein
MADTEIVIRTRILTTEVHTVDITITFMIPFIFPTAVGGIMIRSTLMDMVDGIHFMDQVVFLV